VLPIKTRFAPSPTGLLHLGNARTALFNALLARREGGALLLRVEDTDAARSEARYLEALVEDLAWLGVPWDEGWGAGGACGPYRQGERGEVYAEHFRRLEEAGQAYPCFCSPGTLEAARRAQRAAGRPPRYPGTCARLDPGEAARRRAAGDPATLRFRVPPGQVVQVDDLVRGPQRFATDDIGDFVVRRADGTPAFFFGNALDDALMGVTHVLRGEDHLANTPRQLLLLEALGLPAPRYGHLPLVLDEDGAPLSKRAGSLSLRALRADGWLPGALCNYLARLGHHLEAEAFLDLDALAGSFDLGRIGSAPARFDPAQLRHWQRAAATALGPAEWWLWVEPAAGDRVPPERRGAFTEGVRDNVLLPGDAADWAARLFDDPLAVSDEAQAVLRGADPALWPAAAEALEAGRREDLAAAVKAATGLGGRRLFAPLRAALTGLTHGPELGRLLPLLGAERARSRILAARAAGDPPANPASE
jgi:glutamyl-tRNA synthetase